MFSVDNFLFNHLPYKSRYIYNELYDPYFAYWPDSPKKCRLNDSLFDNDNHWLDEFINELVSTKYSSKKQEESKNENIIHNSEKKENKITDSKISDEDKISEENVEIIENTTGNGKIQVEKSNQDNQVSNDLTLGNFELALNFEPKDIQIKIKDDLLTVCGRKRTNEDNYWCYELFQKSFSIPSNVEKEKITCSMNPNGILKFNVPVKQCPELKNNISVTDDEPIIEDIYE